MVHRHREASDNVFTANLHLNRKVNCRARVPAYLRLSHNQFCPAATPARCECPLDGKLDERWSSRLRSAHPTDTLVLSQPVRDHYPWGAARKLLGSSSHASSGSSTPRPYSSRCRSQRAASFHSLVSTKCIRTGARLAPRISPVVLSLTSRTRSVERPTRRRGSTPMAGTI